MRRLALSLCAWFAIAVPALAHDLLPGSIVVAQGMNFGLSFTGQSAPVVGACNGFAIPGDGCSGAPAPSAYTFQNSGLFPNASSGTQVAGTGQQSGQTYATTGPCASAPNSAVCHPPWAVAGDDYNVGVSTQGSGFGKPGSATDPTIIANYGANPGGCSYSATSSLVTCNAVTTAAVNIGPFDWGPSGNSSGKAIGLNLGTSLAGPCNIHDNNFNFDISNAKASGPNNTAVFHWEGCSARNIINNYVTIFNSATHTSGIYDVSANAILFSFSNSIPSNPSAGAILAALTTMEYNYIQVCPTRCVIHGNLIDKYNYWGGVNNFAKGAYPGLHGDGFYMGFANSQGIESCNCNGVNQVVHQFMTFVQPSSAYGGTTCILCGNVTDSLATVTGYTTVGSTVFNVVTMSPGTQNSLSPNVIGSSPYNSTATITFGGNGSASAPNAGTSIVACPNGVPPTTGACTGEVGAYQLSNPWIAYQSSNNGTAIAAFDQVPTGGVETFNTRPIGSVLTFGTLTAGSGGQSGTYTGVALSGGTCSGVTANVTVGNGTGGIQGVGSVSIVSSGQSCSVGNTLTASSSAIGGTTGFSITVGSINTVNPLVPGSGATSSTTYNGVTMTGGHCTTAPVANITVASGGGVTGVVLTGYGLKCSVGDVLSAASANIGGVTGFSDTVASIGTLNPGTGGTPGTGIPDVVMTATTGSGTGSQSIMTISSGGNVTAITPLAGANGNNFHVGDVVTTTETSKVGPLTGFSTTVLSVSGLYYFQFYPPATVSNMNFDHNVVISNIVGTNSPQAPTSTSMISNLFEGPGVPIYSVTNNYFDSCGVSANSIASGSTCGPQTYPPLNSNIGGSQYFEGNNVQMNNGTCWSIYTQTQTCGSIYNYFVPVASFSPLAADTNVMALAIGLQPASGLTPSITQGAQASGASASVPLGSSPNSPPIVGDAIVAGFEVNTGSSTAPATPTCTDNATGGSNTYTVEQANTLNFASGIYSYIAVAPVTRTNASNFAVTCPVSGASSQTTIAEEATNVATGTSHTTNPTDNPGNAPANAGGIYFGNPASGNNTVQTNAWTQKQSADLLWAIYFGSASTVATGTYLLPFVAGPSATQGNGIYTENTVQSITAPGQPPAIPANTVAPSLTGSTSVGSTLSCNPGTWLNSPTSYSYAWQQNGVNIAGETNSTYVLEAEDQGLPINCLVTATNNGGSASVASNTLSIPASAPSAPVNSAVPAITGATTLGATLTCSTGTWTNSPTSYAYVWKRSGSTISGATSSTYAIVAADQGTSLTCAVTATNAGGSTAATSAALSIPAAVHTHYWYAATAPECNPTCTSYPSGAGYVNVYDIDNSFNLVQTITLPATVKGVRGLFADSTGTHLYIPNYGVTNVGSNTTSGRLLSWNLATNKADYDVAYSLAAIDRACLSSDNSTIYAPSGENVQSGTYASSWYVITATTGAETSIINLTDGAVRPHNTLCSSSTIYMAAIDLHGGASTHHSVTMYNTSTKAQSTICCFTAGDGRVRPLALDATNGLVYVNLEDWVGFAVGKASTGAVLFDKQAPPGYTQPGTTNTVNSHAIAVTPSGNDLYVGDPDMGAGSSTAHGVEHWDISGVRSGTAPVYKSFIGTSTHPNVQSGYVPGWIDHINNGNYVVTETGEVIAVTTQGTCTANTVCYHLSDPKQTDGSYMISRYMTEIDH